jgi:hypothetical protein
MWKIHPAFEQPKKTVLALFLLVLSAIAASFYMGNPFFGLLSFIVLFLGLGSYFFPTTYGVNKTGVIRSISGQKWAKPWHYFSRIVEHKDGIFLSPLTHSSFLDNFRGWFLPTKDDKIRDFIRTQMENK